MNASSLLNDPKVSAITTDRLMLLALTASLATAVAVGVGYGQTGLALALGVPLWLAGALATALRGGGLLARLVLAAALMAMTALHIQLSRGTLEFHFGVFVVLAFLLGYRDWRPIVLAAALIAVHHLLFDRLQALGLGFYCAAEPGLPRVLGHAGFVVAQSAFEIYMAVLLGREAGQGAELAGIVRRVRQADGIQLHVADLAVRSESALALQAALQQVGDSVTAVRDGVTTIATASDEFAAGNADLSRRTESAVGQLGQTARAVEQITEAVRQTAQSSRHASALAARAAEAAHSGGCMIDDAVRAMQDIEKGSHRIADIIGLIDGIAFQTNILALNAAVEAARAGEHGRGFAVVAGEVRTLAQRSATAAREIKTLIGASVERAESGTRIVQQTGQTISGLVDSAQQVAELVRQITEATARQDRELEQVNGAVTQLDAATLQNASLVQQGAAAAGQLRALAARLAAAVAAIRTAPALDQP